MKIIKSAIIAALLPLAGAQADEFVTRARVLKTAPIVETVYESDGNCRPETRRQRRGGADVGDKILGGILGGAAGSAFGKGTGRDAAAGVGALFGSEVAAGDGGLSEGELIGGIVGGVVGNQVGKGGGKTAATGAGVLLGAIVGDNLQNGAARASSETRRTGCTQRAKKIITGYTVTYEYDGVRQTGVLPYDPGEYVDIHVGVSLVENRAARN